MNNFFEFMGAAQPWIAMGILLAAFFAREAKRKKDNEENEDYGSEGTATGMCFGVAMSTALHINVGICMMAGMVLGPVAGSRIGMSSTIDKNGKSA